jgi:hypothetical protein
MKANTLGLILLSVTLSALAQVSFKYGIRSDHFILNNAAPCPGEPGRTRRAGPLRLRYAVMAASPVTH